MKTVIKKEKLLSCYLYLWDVFDRSCLGLVSLFNGISTLFRLFNAKAILLEEQ